MNNNFDTISDFRKVNIIYIDEVVDQDRSPSYVNKVKIGQTSVDIPVNIKENSDEEDILIKKAAEKRANDITGQMQEKLKVLYCCKALRKTSNGWMKFTDKQFHKWLSCSPRNILHDTGGSSTEWFNLSYEQAKKYLDNYINDTPTEKIPCTLRPNQDDASNKIKEYYLKSINDDNVNNKHFLLNAIMRFGKCITSYASISKLNIDKKIIKNVLILTNRPNVLKSWENDFYLYFGDNSEYKFHKNKDIKGFTNDNVTNILFSSIQDARGKDYDIFSDDGDEKTPIINETSIKNWKNKNKWMISTHWDLIILDEAHEAQFSDLATELHNDLKRKFTLYLSGTPFKLLSKDTKKFFENDDSRYDWDYITEQEAKKEWDKKYPDQPNPYYDLPDLTLMGINILSEKYYDKYKDEEKGFKFKALFETNENDEQFINEKDVKDTLDVFCQENMPYHDENYKNTRYSLWLLPSVSSVKAISKLLKIHPIFKNYKIFDVSGTNYSTEDEINSFHKKMEDNNDYFNEDNTTYIGTITLSYNRLTVGSTVKNWTSVLFLNDWKSPQAYLQAAFRAKTPKIYKNGAFKQKALVYDFSPNRILEIATEWSGIERDQNEKRENLKKLLQYANVLLLENNKFKNLEFNDVINKLVDHYASVAWDKKLDGNEIFNKAAIRDLESNPDELAIRTSKLSNIDNPKLDNKIVVNKHDFISDILKKDIPIELNELIKEILTLEQRKKFDGTATHKASDIKKFKESLSAIQYQEIEEIIEEYEELKKINKGKISIEDREKIKNNTRINTAIRFVCKEPNKFRENILAIDEEKENFNAFIKNKHTNDEWHNYIESLSSETKEKLYQLISKEKKIKDEILMLKSIMKDYVIKILQISIGSENKYDFNNGFDFKKFNDSIKKDILFFFPDKNRHEVINNIDNIALLDGDVILKIISNNNEKLNQFKKTFEDNNIDDYIEQICEFLDHLPSSDKEIVFTPYDVAKRVIEKQFNPTFISKMTPNYKYLDINSKNGIFPLLVIQKLLKLKEFKNKKFNDIFSKNIFVISQSHLALNICKRILGQKVNKDYKNMIVYNYNFKLDK